MAQAPPMPMCPMAETCMGMMEMPLPRLVMMIPGITFITLGVLIVVWPSVLPWLVVVVAACIMMGAAMLFMADFMRGIGARLRRAGS
jgi:hypothetical protein